jgi:hypothetical protein
MMMMMIMMMMLPMMMLMMMMAKMVMISFAMPFSRTDYFVSGLQFLIPLGAIPTPRLSRTFISRFAKP